MNIHSKHKIVKTLASLGLATFVMTATGMPLSSTIAMADTTQDSMNTLAAQMVTLSSKAHDGGTVATMAAPILNIIESSNFDWNEVMFGTDQTSQSQQQTASLLTPAIVQVVSMQTPTTASATALIQTITSDMQLLNPSIQTMDVVNFLSSLVQQSPSEMLTLISLNQPNATNVSQALHAFFAANLASASPSIQALFSTTGVKAGGSAGVGTGSGATSTSGGSAASGGNAGGAGSTSRPGTSTGADGNGSSPRKPNQPTLKLKSPLAHHHQHLQIENPSESYDTL